MQDMDQILSNFIPYNNPYIILSWKEPSVDSSQIVEIRSEVLWGGSISLTEPTDTTYSDKFRVVADTSFTIKGWLFKNKNDTSNQIYFINSNIIPINKNMIIDEDNYNSFFAAASGITDIETISLSATPNLTKIYYNISGQGKLHEITSNFNINNNFINNFLIYGNNFNHTTLILLSATNTINGTLTSINSKYTGTTTGYILDSQYYNILSDNMLTISLPTLTGACNFNFIVNNVSGWSSSYNINNFTFANM